MKNKLTSKLEWSVTARWIVCAGIACATVATAHGQWYFDVGPAYRGDMKISVRGGTRALEDPANADGSITRGHRAEPGGSFPNDDGSAQIARSFDDGHVDPSGWGWARHDGTTQAWGYDSPGQYDGESDTLTFHLTLDDRATQRQTQTSKRTESMGWSGNRRADGFGIMGTVGYLLRQEESWSLGIQGRFGWLDGIDANFRNRPAFRQSIERSTYESSVTREATYTYTYDTLGNPAFPAAPYSMEDPNAVGPMIADRPNQITTDGPTLRSSDRLAGRSSETVASSVDLSVDAQTFVFQLGPRLLWSSEKSAAFFVQPAFTANLLDVSVDRLETFRRSNGTVVTSWRDSTNTYKWKMGVGVQAGVQVPLSESWRLSASGGYEWIDKYSLSVGPDQVHMDLSGYQVELAVGRSF